VPADRLLPLPDGVDPVAAAALPTAYVTAERMLRRADVEPGDRLLVPGATGGVGVATVRLAELRGLRVVGSSRSAGKPDRLADLGLDRGIVAGDADTLADATGDGGFDAVVNHLGGDYTAAGIGALRSGGRMLVCGRTAGRESTVSVPALYRGQVAPGQHDGDPARPRAARRAGRRRAARPGDGGNVPAGGDRRGVRGDEARGRGRDARGDAVSGPGRAQSAAVDSAARSRRTSAVKLSNSRLASQAAA